MSPAPVETADPLLVIRKRVAHLLEKKNFRRALDLLKQKGSRNRPVEGLEREYAAAVNGLLEKGDEAVLHHDYASAGHNFKRALDAYPTDSQLQTKVKWGLKSIRHRIQVCSTLLMDQGLSDYRQGRLESAIRTWKGIIAFNADYIEARKAIETALVQKHSLQELSPQQ